MDSDGNSRSWRDVSGVIGWHVRGMMAMAFALTLYAQGGELVRLRITEYNKACEHMKDFVDVKLRYAGKEKFSAVLIVGTNPVAAVGGRDAKGRVIDLKWQVVSFRVPRDVICGQDEDVAKALGRGVILRCMKRQVGKWELKGRTSGPIVRRRVDSVVCRMCWGEKACASPPPIDVSKEARERMKGKPLPDKVKYEVGMIVAKYGRLQQGMKVPCTFCIDGKVKLKNGPGYSQRHSLVFDLNLKKPEDYTKEAEVEQGRDFDTVEGHCKDVEKMDKKFAESAAREKAIKEVDKLVDEYVTRLKVYKELELIYWKRPADIVDGNIATGRVDLKNSGVNGHRPKKLFNLNVRRMTDWQRIPGFRPIGRLGRNGYSITSAHYRLVEIGGNPVVNTEEGVEGVKRVVPDDILERQYIIQYAATIATAKKIRAAVTFSVNFAENPEFKLQADEKKLIVRHVHVLPEMWHGDMIGAQPITLNQLLADFLHKDAIELNATVTMPTNPPGPAGSAPPVPDGARSLPATASEQAEESSTPAEQPLSSFYEWFPAVALVTVVAVLVVIFFCGIARSSRNRERVAQADDPQGSQINDFSSEASLNPPKLHPLLEGVLRIYAGVFGLVAFFAGLITVGALTSNISFNVTYLWRTGVLVSFPAAVLCVGVIKRWRSTVFLMTVITLTMLILCIAQPSRPFLWMVLICLCLIPNVILLLDIPIRRYLTRNIIAVVLFAITVGPLIVSLLIVDRSPDVAAFLAGFVFFVAVPLVAVVCVIFLAVNSRQERDLFAYLPSAPSLPRGSEGGEEIDHQIQTLDFCIDELERRVSDAGPTQWIWECKLRVARFFHQKHVHRINWEPSTVLTDEEKEQILKEHPLLRDSRTPPPNPADRYAQEQWYKEIRAEVREFIEKKKEEIE